MEIVSSVILFLTMFGGLAALAVSKAKEDIRREQESERAWLNFENANGHVYYF